MKGFTDSIRQGQSDNDALVRAMIPMLDHNGYTKIETPLYPIIAWCNVTILFGAHSEMKGGNRLDHFASPVDMAEEFLHLFPKGHLMEYIDLLMFGGRVCDFA